MLGALCDVFCAIWAHLTQPPTLASSYFLSARQYQLKPLFPWSTFKFLFIIPCIQTAWSKNNCSKFPSATDPGPSILHSVQVIYPAVDWRFLDHRSKVPANLIDSNNYPLGGRHGVLPSVLILCLIGSVVCLVRFPFSLGKFCFPRIYHTKFSMNNLPPGAMIILWVKPRRETTSKVLI